MSYYDDKGPKPKDGRFIGFDHATFWVGNALQAAGYYTTRMGFTPIGYKGLETGSRDMVSHAVRQGKIVFVFQSPLEPNNPEMSAYLAAHGDSVRDIAFRVEDLDAIVARSKERGASIYRDTWEECDEHGTVRFATIKTFGDVMHTLVERNGYAGDFLPGFHEHPAKDDPLLKFLPPCDLDHIDHAVGNQFEDGLEPVTSWYEQGLMFHRYWSADDKLIHTEHSALRSIVVADWDETIKMPINEPAPGKAMSQTKEFAVYNGGPGIQHFALITSDIIKSVRNLRARGVQFIQVPDTYYEIVRENLKKTKITVQEDFDALQELGIVIDYDENGYLLQIFTKPLQDRPTFFMEIMQRHNNSGFGAGNFKWLFEALELQQKRRGNLN